MRGGGALGGARGRGRGTGRPGGPGRRWLRWLGGLAVMAVLAGWGLGWSMGWGPGRGPGRVWFNSSASLPRGLYLLDDAGGARPGDLVLACPPAAFARLALARGYLRRGGCPGGSRPLGKVLLAVAGDRLEVGAGAVALDGRRLPGTASAAADGEGRPLPRAVAGARRVGEGEVWLVSPHPRSVDSRYFGPIGAGQVLGRLVPLLTAGGADPGGLAGEIRRAHGGVGGGGVGSP
jgi:conjugative transfer signal peptidase TraF